jgi:hypothetical protein
MARSKLAQMVEDEASKAEAESPDDDEAETEDETEDEDEAAEDADEAQAEPEAVAEPLSMEAMQKALEGEAIRHAKTLADIFGETFEQYDECPMCFMLGFVAPESPVLDPTTQRCGRCRGYGFLLTESVAGENATRQCPDCMGNGYLPRVDPVPASPVFEAGAPNGQPQTYTIPPMPIFDATRNAWLDPQGNVLVVASP